MRTIIKLVFWSFLLDSLELILFFLLAEAVTSEILNLVDASTKQIGFNYRPVIFASRSENLLSLLLLSLIVL
jgi:hypothetical protein